MSSPPARILDRFLLASLGLAFAAGLTARLQPRPGLSVSGALGVVVALLGIRLGLGLRQALGGELPWGRLLIPGILFAEGGAALMHPGPNWLWARAATVGCLELGLIVAAVQIWRRPGGALGQWPEDRLAERLQGFVPPRMAWVLSVELVVLAGALRFLAGGWRQQAEPGGFSYHRESTLGALLMALPVMVIADLLLMEVLLRRLAPWIRFTVHALDLYGLLWIVGFWASLRLRPHRIADGMVHLYRGLAGRAVFPVSQVGSLVPVPQLLEGAERRAFLGQAVPFGARGGAEILVNLAEPAMASGLFGRRRPMTRAVVAVDAPDAFVVACQRQG